MLNTFVFMGRLTRDPEFQFTPSGVALCKFTLVQDKPGRTEGGEKEALFVDCECWRKTAEFARDYLVKGKPVIIEGRLNIRSFVKSDGTKGRATAIEVEKIDFVLRDSTEHSGATHAAETTTIPTQVQAEDDPFGDE